MRSSVSLRKTHPVLKYPGRDNLSVNYDKEQNTLVLLRWHESNHMLCLMNFSKEKRGVKFTKAADWKKIFDSADSAWGGPGTSIVSTGAVQQQPEFILILSTFY